MLKRIVNPFIYLALICSTCKMASAQDTTITTSDIKAAEKIMGVTFDDKERSLMLDEVKANSRALKNLKKQSLPNSCGPVYYFNPVIKTATAQAKQIAINWNIPTNVALPADRNELAFYSVQQLASLIKSKKISAVELTRFFIDRLKKYGDTLHCVISLTEKIAMQQALQADAEIKAGKYRGALHGIPYGVKDLLSVKNTKTTWGATPFKDQQLDETATVVTKLEQAGAILIAKLSMGELAMDDEWFGGLTRNPWNTKEGSSGSSAGSAAATAAGLVPFAIGSETWGSIISPCTVCGATGLRPTFGAVSRNGAMTLCWTLDKLGPICRSAEDAAIVFNTIRGEDDKDRSVQNKPFNYTPNGSLANKKIAYAVNYLKRDSSYRQTILELQKAGVNLIPSQFPDSVFADAPAIIYTILLGEAGAAFDEFSRSNKDDELIRQKPGGWPNIFKTANLISAVDYVNANRHRYVLAERFNDYMNSYDVLIMPSLTEIELSLTNLTGHPAVCLPNGFDKKGMPTSVTLIGNLYDEATILTAAAFFQRITPYSNMHPDKFKK